MHCDGCAARLQKVLAAVSGIQSAEVSFADENASVEYDSAGIEPGQIQKAIENAGFEVSP